jgi:hypothetical protein
MLCRYPVLRIAVALAALGLGAVCLAQERTIERRQDFSRDPLWQGVNNRLRPEPAPEKRQDFGYRRTNHAGAAAGEIGGVVWRSVKPAWYAKKIEPLTFESRLSASGKFALTQATHTQGWQTGSTIFVGFFNAAEQGWRPINFMGFALSGTNEPLGSATLSVSYGTRLYEAGGGVLRDDVLPTIAPDGAPHDWSIDYDPEANSGQGTLTLTVDGRVIVLAPTADHRKHGGTFDRFGIFNLQLPGGPMTAYFDDLAINGVREDFSSDPGWDAVGNEETFRDPLGYGMNDFGFSPTNHAGGNAGEMGGRIWQVQEPEYFAHYGGDVGHLTMNDKLEAKGRIAFKRFSIDSALHFGWYNADSQGFPPKNFLGVYMDSYSTIGRFLTPAYATSQSRLETTPQGKKQVVGTRGGGLDLVFVPDGRVYDWAIRYDPAANDGTGAISVTLGAESTTLDLLPEHRAAGAAFNRFGLFNAQGNNGKDTVLYVDDLEYTAER